MSSGEISKLADVTADVVNKILEENKKRQDTIKEQTKEEEYTIEKEPTKEERLSGIYNELNSSEIALFKQLPKVDSEDLDNHYSDSFGNSKHDQQRKYNEMAKLLSNKSVEKVESLYEENIYGGMGEAPKGKIDYVEIEEVEKTMNEQKNIKTPEQSSEKTPEINLEKEMEEHSKEINDFVDTEVINENDSSTNLTKEELEGILNDHFKRIEDVLHDYEDKNIDADTFKSKLQSLTNHVKDNARSLFSKVKHKTTQPIKDLKNYSRNKIDSFMNKTNDKLKQISNSIDNKFQNNEVTPVKEINTEMNYKQKIEQTLRNDPELFKKALAVTQINSIKKHLESSKDTLEQLNEVKKDDIMEQNKIDDMKRQLTSHIDGMEKELNTLEKSHDPKQTIDNINEQTKGQEKEHENKNEQSKDKAPAKKEEVMER